MSDPKLMRDVVMALAMSSVILGLVVFLLVLAVMELATHLRRSDDQPAPNRGFLRSDRRRERIVGEGRRAMFDEAYRYADRQDDER